jgi:DNA (cytosine-5)-methyltransferase 1
MDTVELFSGIGGFRVASDARSFRTVWANDADPKACAVYRDRFGTAALREGDINELESDVPAHRLLTGGFPCQPFSSAGKKRGVRDPRGTLFQSIANVLARRQPDFFILENVKRLLSMEAGAHFATILSVLADLDYRIEWRLINALHFGLPQNRQRVVLVGVHHRLMGDVPTLRLVDDRELATLPPRRIEHLIARESWREIGTHGLRFPTWGVAERGRFFGESLGTFTDAGPQALLMSFLEDVVPDSFDFTESTLKRIENSRAVGRFVEGVEILNNQGGGARMGYTVFGINGVAPTLTATPSRHYERYRIGGRYRRLTNVEYARLQGFADDHCRVVTPYDQYGLIGNAVPPPMAGWAMGRVVAPGCLPTALPGGQRDLFSVAS